MDTLAPTIAPANATNKAVTWTSSNASVATVSNTGKVTAVSAGTAIITTTTADGNKTGICTVTVSNSAVNVTAVSLNKTTDSLVIGSIDTLSATVSPSSATNKVITWTSSDSAIATVDNTGKVNAVSAGTATITATTVDGSKTSTCTVTVNNPIVNVTAISLSKATDTLLVGSTDNLSATVSPSDVTNKTVTWTSSDTFVAKVDTTGKVTTVSAGTAIITATTVDGSKTATCSVTVNNPIVHPTTVSLNKTLDTLIVGDTDNLIAAITPNNATDQGVTWKSSDITTATVDNVGKITAIGVGTATITATTVDGSKTVSCTVTVNNPIVNVTSISLNKSLDTLTVGGTDALTSTATPIDSTNKAVTWTSSDITLATVDNTGKVTAVSAGTVTITATTVDGSKTATCIVTVNNPIIHPATVGLNKTLDTLTVGDTDSLIAAITPNNATNQAVIWISSDITLATVGNIGKVTAVSAGTVTITATTVDGSKTATCIVTVNNPVVHPATVSLNKTSDTLIVGDIDNLTAAITPNNATNQAVTWASSDITLATVDSTGKVTAVSAGTATITATTVDESKIATCAITISNPVINVVSVNLNKTTDSIIVGSTDTLTSTIAPITATNNAVTWKSSDITIAAVDNSGKITAIGVGTATITATTVYGSKIATCIVTVNNPIIKATSVSLNKTTDSLTVGNTDTLIATVLPINVTDIGTTWTSSDNTIATVDNTGKITTIKAGVVIIIATTADGGLFTYCTVTVNNPIIPVSSLSLNKNLDTLTIGDTDTLITTITPTNATNKNITWTSSDISIVTVDSTGKITAVGSGIANVTAESNDGTLAIGISCVITVNNPIIPVASISLNKTTDTLTVGGFDNLIATVTPYNVTNSRVTWTSSNTNVATIAVDANGHSLDVTAVGAGIATITVTAADGLSATCIVTVNPVVNVSSINLNKNTDTIIVGSTDNLSTIVAPSNATNKAVTWSSSDNTIATVDNLGKVTAISAGTATITVTTTDGNKTDTCTVTVPEVKVSSISLNKTTDTLTVGGFDNLIATVTPYNVTNSRVTWTSSNTNVATIAVDANGHSLDVTAVGAGIATITVTAADGLSATCIVTVNPVVNVASISLNKTNDTLMVGDIDYLTAIITPNNVTNQAVTWTSSDNSIATVDNTGKVTAVGNTWNTGTTTITVTTADGSKTASCLITVYNEFNVLIGLNKYMDTLTVGNADTLLVTPGSAATAVIWSSSNTSIATIVNGKVTAISEGTATITASDVLSGNSAKCLIKVITPVVYPTSVNLNKTTDNLIVGSIDTLTSTVAPSNATNQAVTWTSLDNTIATVDSTGKITAVSAGTTTITVTTVDGNKTTSCIVTVSNSAVNVSSIILNKTTDIITVGSADVLSATLVPINATNQVVTWTSSDNTIATVDNTGIVTAVSEGTAIITATVDGNITASCTVTVSGLSNYISGNIDISKDTTINGNLEIAKTRERL